MAVFLTQSDHVHMSEPYKVRLNANTARELAQKGATIILLDVPEGTVIGMDQQTFLAGPKFKGIKMVPPGVHAVSYAATDIQQGGFGPTTAFFLNARGGEVAAWRWHAHDEILQRVTEEGEIAALTNAVKSFHLDQNLAPYNLSAYPAWKELAGHVTARTLEAVAPVGGNINILAEAENFGGAPTAAEAALEEALKKGRIEHPDDEHQEGSILRTEHAAPHAGRCFFTPLPRLVKKSGLTPAELTALNLDKSSVLEELLERNYGGDESAFLGEFQFAFLAFLLGHSLQGFHQWKECLRLMMGCEDAPLGAKRTGLFTNFLLALHYQLFHALAPGCSSEEQAAPLGTPMVEELLEDSFLRRLCTGWLRWVASEGASVPQPLSEAARGVATLLQKTVGWECGPVEELGGGGEHGDDDEEDDEDGPVVVLDVEGIE